MGFFDAVIGFNKNPAEAIDNLLQPIGEVVIETVCMIRSKYPNTFLRGGVLDPVMARLCYDSGAQVPLPPPLPLFRGGQCPGVRYGVGGTFKLTVKPPDETPRAFYLGVMYGPIEAVYVTNSPHNGAANGTWIEAKGRNSAGNEAYSSSLQSSAKVQGSIVSVDLNRTDGLVDNCGDPLPPGREDPPIDLQDFSRQIEICGTPEDNNDQRCVIVPIDFFPFLDENGNQCYLIDGRKYCFTPDGIKPEDDGEEDEFPDITDTDPDPEKDDVEDDEEEDEKIKYVTTKITTFPSQGKTILQKDELDNDYFAGYFNWFITNEEGKYMLPAMPIRKVSQIFKNIDEADGYRLYTVNNAKISVQVFKEKGKEEN